MEVGFFFWPYTRELCERLARVGEQHGYDMIGIADTPGNAMDPWVSATLVAGQTSRIRISLCVTNVVTRDPAVSAAAIASLDHVSGGRAVLGIGAGHSGTRNIGRSRSTAKEMGDAIVFIKQLLRGEPATLGDVHAHMPWIERPAKVFLAASHPLALETAGAVADGVFQNYGIGAENVSEASAVVARGTAKAGRRLEDVETWQIAALDCTPDGETARAKVGAMLAFLAGYVIGDRNLEKRGVPERYREPLLELRRRYSTRPGDADIRLVRELGLFDYLSGRLAVCGTPDECLAQALCAKAAGVKRLMLTVSLASDPVQVVELFGRHVLPELRKRA